CIAYCWLLSAAFILTFVCFILSSICYPRVLPSFPTRRSSDLGGVVRGVAGCRHRAQGQSGVLVDGDLVAVAHGRAGEGDAGVGGDRKSTRLNSSHVKISYAVFCLKKKKGKHIVP